MYYVLHYCKIASRFNLIALIFQSCPVGEFPPDALETEHACTPYGIAILTPQLLCLLPLQIDTFLKQTSAIDKSSETRYINYMIAGLKRLWQHASVEISYIVYIYYHSNHYFLSLKPFISIALVN